VHSLCHYFETRLVLPDYKALCSHMYPLAARGTMPPAQPPLLTAFKLFDEEILSYAFGGQFTHWLRFCMTCKDAHKLGRQVPFRAELTFARGVPYAGMIAGLNLQTMQPRQANHLALMLSNLSIYVYIEPSMISSLATLLKNAAGTLQALHLEHTACSSAQLSELFASIQKCTKMTDLHFGELAPKYFAAQGNAVSSTFASLASLGIGMCELSAQDMQNLVGFIESSQNLHTLAFEYTTLPQAGFDALATALYSVPLLQTLTLKNVMTDNWNLEALASALSQLSQLKSFNIHGCHMQPAHACTLFEAMHGLTQLETLALRSNKLGSLGAQALARALPNLPEIRNLYCASASLCAGDVREFFSAIPTGNLRRLELNNNKIGEQGGKALTEALKSFTLLESVGLRHCKIGAKQTRELVVAMGRHCRPRKLDLYDNNLGDEGAGKVMQTLSSYPGLVSLDTGSNQIGESGVREIASLLPCFSGLHTFILSHNIINQASARALTAALDQCSSLKFVDLSSPSLSREAHTHFSDCTYALELYYDIHP